jgi:ornithine carbamoyltransferase
MGQEGKPPRARVSPYHQVKRLLAQARPEAIFMHCLPAKRSQEVTDSVMVSAQLAVFDEAENRLYAQKAPLMRFYNRSPT